ncbi:TonB-dependent receptor [Tamlana sp. 62-3]|uniref:TonB-dependent receptor n=1 Tax=Neotamlana sargassicola TaxID=2883125 RepID=A0A9X1L914_9FLAO|nr:TonB-dependent receptor [Tamlana sargassicola]MCB4809418.1 TonB-dependent receptor [Tamlana sargassicola]
MKLTKRLLYLLLFSGLFGYTQNTINGKIIDAETNAAIAFAEIIKTQEGNSITSDINGNFQLTSLGLYTFKKSGYLPVTIKVSTFKKKVVKLNINPSELNEVIVNSNLIPQSLKLTSAAINIITPQDIERSNNINFVSVLNRTPGVFMQTGSLNTNKISIRGIGARNQYGTSKIRAYFKDIPLTNGSGETNIEDFELGSISSLQITKGAVSSIYGAGLGGLIQLNPKSSNFKSSTLSNTFTFGSFGLFKNLVQLNTNTTKTGINAIYSYTEHDGYRDNNNYNRQTLTLNANHYINPNNELHFLMSYVDLKAFIPSSIDEDSYLNTPTSAAFTWEASQGLEDFNRGVFGLSWEHLFSKNTKQITSVFTSFKNNYEPRPFNILTDDNVAFGIRTRTMGNTKLFKNTLKWTTGIELFTDNYAYKTFENLYEDFPPNTGSVKGEELSNFKENRSYFNLFFEANQNLNDDTVLNFGINLNQTWYNLEDNFPASNENLDQSGSFNYKTIISPKLGITHQFHKNTSVYASLSHGFSPITLSETLLPNGQINNDLKPETAWNYEIGTRHSFFKNKLQLNTSIYSLQVKNLLVARRTSEDEYIGINAGKTQHNGLELNLNYQLISNSQIQIATTSNFSLNYYKFKDFIDDENDYSGNEVTGVPKNMFNFIVDFNSMLGIYGNINFQHVGKIPVTDANTLYSKNYNLSHSKIGFKKALGKKLKTDIFAGINNIFNTKYASQILINATGFGASAPRYYYPGNPVNYFCGANLKYQF